LARSRKKVFPEQCTQSASNQERDYIDQARKLKCADYFTKLKTLWDELENYQMVRHVPVEVQKT